MKTQQSLPKPSLSNEELIERVQEWVTKLCKSSGRAWTLRVPADVNHDPDFLITELCRRFSATPIYKPDKQIIPDPSIAIPELEEVLTSQLPAPAKVNQLMTLIENYKAK